MEERYCCAINTNESGIRFCYGEPTMEDEVERHVECWEFPYSPMAALSHCDEAETCIPNHPWCCFGLLGLAYCSADALLGWTCVDLAGEAAGSTMNYREDLFRRCAEDEPCPAEFPFCCDNLFCSDEPLHGWSCAIR